MQLDWSAVMLRLLDLRPEHKLWSMGNFRDLDEVQTFDKPNYAFNPSIVGLRAQLSWEMGDALYTCHQWGRKVLIINTTRCQNTTSGLNITLQLVEFLCSTWHVCNTGTHCMEIKKKRIRKQCICTWECHKWTTTFILSRWLKSAI